MISIVIPTYNEGECIAENIHKLRNLDGNNLIKEIIIADGGSTDDTIKQVRLTGEKVIISPKKGRAAQMNYGASYATGEILYFLHADSIPPKDFTADIARSVKTGFGAGCFMLSFDYNHWFLKANCWFTRFDVNAIRFGDQSLFVNSKVFEKSGGFCEKHIVMEDQEFVSRLKRITRFTIIKRTVLTSARKYLKNGIYKTQAVFFIIYSMYRLGYSQEKLVITYKKLLAEDKLI